MTTQEREHQWDASYLIVSGAATARRVPSLLPSLLPHLPGLRTLLTDNAARIIAPRELATVPGHTIVESYFDASILPRPPEGPLVVLPCSFNTLHKLAHGVADSLALSVTQEAIGRCTPVLVVLSLNTPLWEHPLTTVSVARLREWGVQVLEPRPDAHGYYTLVPDADIIAAVQALVCAD